MKKILALLLAMSMLLCLAACGDDSGNKQDNQDKDNGSTAAVSGTEGANSTNPTEGVSTTPSENAPTEGDNDTTTSTSKHTRLKKNAPAPQLKALEKGLRPALMRYKLLRP